MNAGFNDVGCVFAAAGASVLKFFAPRARELEASVFCWERLIPGGALATLPRIGAIAFLYEANFIPMLSPTNHMVYDLSAFLNNALRKALAAPSERPEVVAQGRRCT